MKKQIVYEGLSYHTEDESAPNFCKGFGGRHFTVRFHDGEIVRTSNLFWDYGVRPKTGDTCVIFAGWGETSEDNRCRWVSVEKEQVFVAGNLKKAVG